MGADSKQQFEQQLRFWYTAFFLKRAPAWALEVVGTPSTVAGGASPVEAFARICCCAWELLGKITARGGTSFVGLESARSM